MVVVTFSTVPVLLVVLVGVALGFLLRTSLIVFLKKLRDLLNSLPSVGESDFPNLCSSSRSSEINVVLDENQVTVDTFLGSRVEWRIDRENGGKSLVMKVRKNNRRRILVPYLQHIHQAYDEMEQKRKTVRLFLNVENNPAAMGDGGQLRLHTQPPWRRS